ncbi:hypothetical protein CYLTODRAFT_348802 [Cylindrobasidium torrendii FP15055 ss-10]|uniref:rRNA-processing protein EFG1 n=1 Tax=Cylindrobasidium torrendii FP15055 ss-10 TaxID=1314674 RepID=A0A0D7BHW1_9AGAR|nr:hypothetical protein CYLTODRAFT_348802 [Cylindrobasidium torrendii FP15055 ss-10]
MAPTRTPKTQRKHNESKTRPNTDKLGHTPGVSKIKASLRQTQRLLAKDTLTPDVRVKTERRLKGLQDELAEAELRNKEKTLSTRYHAVKFFERQKAARKIKKLQKKLDSASSKGKQKYTDELFSARVDLNYILNYPRLKKYISLFPPETSEPKPQPSSSATDTQRDEMRAQIRKRMQDGELTMEPEKEMSERPIQQRAKPSMKKTSDVSVAAQDHVEEDTFFGDDDDEEDGSDGDGDSDSS